MDVKLDILYRYPYPVAMTYHNADNAREVQGAHCLLYTSDAADE